MIYKYPYLEQFDRIKRLNARLANYSEITDNNLMQAIDDFTSFFIQCYHLSDWLIKSDFDKKMVYRYIQDKNCLKLCRDIANTQKHQKIDRYKPENSFVDFGFGITTPITRFVDNFGDGKAKLGVDIWELGSPTEALEIADRCIKDWEEFIKDNKNLAINKKEYDTNSK